MQTPYFVATQASGAKGGLVTAGNASGTTTSTPVDASSPNSHLQEGVSAFAAVLLLAGFLLAMRRARFQRKAVQGEEGSNPQVRSSIPCQNCHYFNPNTFLPCAVHPSLALRKEAVDCTDYCPRHKTSVSRSTHS